MRKLLLLAGFIFLLFSHHAAYAEQAKKTPKIAVIGAHNPEYDHIGHYAHLSKLAYAKKHGYDVHLYTEYLRPLEEVVWWPAETGWWQGYWYKILATQRHLAEYDWLFYVDSDAIIMNDSIKLESLIDENYDMIATWDGGETPILSGQFLIKNSEWSRQFLRKWLAIGNTNIQPGFDGGALIQLFSENKRIRKHIKLIPVRKMGSYSWDYAEGDFIIQFAGFIHELKAQYMKEFYEKSIQANR